GEAGGEGGGKRVRTLAETIAALSLRAIAWADPTTGETGHHAMFSRGQNSGAHQHDRHRSGRGRCQCNGDGDRKCGALWLVAIASVARPDRARRVSIALSVADQRQIGGNGGEAWGSGVDHERL